MTEQEFKMQYLGEFTPDPTLRYTVEFLRHATEKEISIWKRNNLVDSSVLREARRILEKELDDQE